MGRGRLLPAFFIARAGPLVIRKHQAALTFPPVSLKDVSIVAVRPCGACRAHCTIAHHAHQAAKQARAPANRTPNGAQHTMTTPPTSASQLRQRAQAVFRPRAVRYGLATLATLVLLFGLAGYFWLPGFAKNKLETLLSEEFARPVRIEGITISPYALSATITGFSVGHTPENALFAFDKLYVNLSSTSLARGIPVVSEVRLSGPRLYVRREATGGYNFSDLLDKWTAPPAVPAEPSGPTPQFSVANITLEGGVVIFDDQLEQARHDVTEITLGIPFLTNAEGEVDSTVEPKFSAKVNGALLALSGTARPFAPGQDAALVLDIKDFDLMRLDEYAPPDLPARLESARLDTQLTIAFSHPQKQDAQVRVSGRTTLRDVALASARKGGAKLKLGRAELTLDEATLAGAVRGALSLADFSVLRGAEPLFAFAGLEVKGIDASTAKRQATVAEVLLKQPGGAVRRLASGELDVQQLAGDFTAAGAQAKPVQENPAQAAPAQALPAKTTAAAGPAQQKPAAKPQPAWAWSVGRIAVEGGKLTYTDMTIGKKGRSLTASELALRREGVGSSPGSAGTPGASSKLNFSSRINERGSVGVQGSFTLAPVAAELDLDLAHVDLVALQSWATSGLNAILTRGEVSAKGRLTLAGEDAAFKGELALIDFNVLDKLNATDLLRWRSLRLTGLDAGSSPLRFGVSDISLASFYARVLLSPEGRLNLQDVMHKDEGTGDGTGDGKTGQKSALAAQNKPAPVDKPSSVDKPGKEAQKTGAEPQIRIGRINLSGGNIIFTDRFIKPNYTANLTDLSGHIGALRAGTMTTVAIRGKVDRTGPLDISGTMDPLGKVLNLDIKAKATGIEMSTFSPYSGRYVGYAIEKGKLSVDVHYHVENGALKAENKVFLDQLTFGNKVDSPDAMSVPVNLLVALLSNSRGEIDINLPVEGSLNDPEFSVGGIIVKVIMNLLVKAATSPFTLLASLFGGGEELSYLAFEPGRATLTPEAVQHLETLSKALRDRPGLKLDIAGHVDPQVELEGLKRAALEHQVKAKKATEMARRGKTSGSVAEVTMTPEEYPRYLERVYKSADIKKPRNLIGLPKGLPVEEMEALLLANAVAGKDDMERLAQDRGIAVQAWLVEKGGVDQSRVFLLAPKVGGESPKDVPAGGRVDFSLR